MEEKLVKINFFVEEKVFENIETSFAVLNGTYKNVSLVAVGALSSVDQGENLTLVGHYTKNEIYGNQFKVLKFKRELPSTKRAIIKFLASGKIKGLQTKTAEKIVDCFGTESLDVLENNPEKLRQVKGIGEKLINNIEKDIKNLLALKRLNIFLQQFNITPKTCYKIWEKWGLFAIEKIKKNPYSLFSFNFNLSFKKVDKIAKTLNVKQNEEKRIQAATQLILNHNALLNGHSCVPKKSLALVVSSFLKQDKSTVLKEIDKLIENNILFSKKTTKEFVFLPIYYFAERFIAQKIVALNQFEEKIDDEDFKNLISIEEERLKIKFTKLQKKAIKTAIENGVFVLTGGPGTGKTTILNAVVSILEQTGFNISICAPTGKAAKRLQEVTKKKATTIHRLLGVVKTADDEREFVHSEKKPLKADVVVIDEMSMVDCMLFESLLKALKNGCRLILAGDFNQLPCISAGNILKNILDSKIPPIVCLKEIFRQSRKSLIVTNAHNIINEAPLILNEKGKDFFFIEKNTPTEISKTVLNLLGNKLKDIAKNKEDVQVICPCKKGIVGTIELNKKIQDVVNKKSDEKEEFNFGFFTFREGDKLLQIKNNYDIPWEKGGVKGEGIFNGEIGTILKINKKEQTFIVDFDRKIATLDFSMAKDLEPAFAITVHKSQGSEFLVVVIPIFFKDSEFFSRNLLYTAITRAKKLLILVGPKQNLLSMCKQKRVNFRYSLLKEFLIEEDREIKKENIFKNI